MNQFLEKCMQELDELEVQVSLGLDELSDAFEKQKAHLGELVESVQEQVKDKADAQKLRTRLDELKVQLALGRAESHDAYEAQKDKLEEALKNTQSALSTWSDEADEKVSGLTESLKEKASQFETKMDLFKLQFALGKAEAKEEWEEKRQEMKEHLHSLRSRVHEGSEKAEDRWDDFTEEISEAFGHVKKAWKGLFD